MVIDLSKTLLDHGVDPSQMHFDQHFGLDNGQVVSQIVDTPMELEGFKLAIDNSPNHIIVTDVNGVIKYANPIAEKITGFRVSEMLGQTPRLWGGLMDKEFYENLWRTIKIDRQKFISEILNRRKNGELYTALLQISHLMQGDKLVGFVATEEDISVRKQIEKDLEDAKTAARNVLEDLQFEKEELDKAKAKDEAIIESIADGLIITDEKGTIVRVNDSFEKLLGWKAEEVLGKDMLDVVVKLDEKDEIIPRQKRSLTRVLTREIKSGRVSTLIATHSYIKKDGSKMPVVGVVAPIILKSKAAGAVQLFRDVTQEKELDKMKDEFMDIAAHDLRTPAAAIRGFISRVLDGDAGEISDKAKDLLKDAYEGNMRLIDLVDDFLSVSRLEQGKIQITPVPGDLTKIIETSVNELSGLSKAKGLTLEYKKVILPAVLADEGKTIQVLNNLIGNAIKFTEKGGITINHSVERGEVITNITDTGIGISPDSQTQLFQKYNKGEEGVSRSGLGLGLYISKLCIEGSGGRIWVKSKKDKGSTFSFSLPIAK
jgi:PAS domain S-box-containing protein